MIYETKEVEGFTCEVFYDDCPESPRDWDNLGTFVGFHGRYVSPDTPPTSDPMEAKKIAESDENICLRVWLYDHSGTCYRATPAYNPFTCPWDSGLFGFIYVSKKKIREEFGVKKVGSALRQRIIKALQHEVEIYSAYANGECYGWAVKNAAGDVLDSCGGYIGEPEHAMAEAESMARHYATTDLAA